ncbi:MAG: Cof-type HAD-IIB family hydrolase [Actinomycetes bacterium]
MVPLTVRLVATDLDGTLLRNDGTVSGRTVSTLRRVEESGITVVMVSGRPPRWLTPVADMVGHTGVALGANGAVVVDLHTGRIVHQQTLTTDTTRDVVRALDAAIPGLTFAVERDDRYLMEVPREDLGPEGQIQVATREELWEAPAFKLLARHGELTPDELLAVARDALGDSVEVTHSSRGSALLEISAAGVSKASGLAALAADLGVSADDVIAFGDMPNDLPMLAWAGQAWAMANAHPDVLAAVDHVTVTNDEDGVAVVLEDELLG